MSMMFFYNNDDNKQKHMKKNKSHTSIKSSMAKICDSPFLTLQISSPATINNDSLRHNLLIVNSQNDVSQLDENKTAISSGVKKGTKRKRQSDESEKLFSCEFCSKKFRCEGYLRVHAKSRESKGVCPKDQNRYKKKKYISPTPVVVNEDDDSSNLSAATSASSSADGETSVSTWCANDDSNPELDRDYEIFSAVQGEEVGKDITTVVLKFSAY